MIEFYKDAEFAKVWCCSQAETVLAAICVPQDSMEMCDCSLLSQVFYHRIERAPCPVPVKMSFISASAHRTLPPVVRLVLSVIAFYCDMCAVVRSNLMPILRSRSDFRGEKLVRVVEA